MKTLTKILLSIVALVFVSVVSAQTVITSKSYQTDFEDAQERGQWRRNSGLKGPKCPSKWFFGAPGANTGNFGLFISGDNGATNSYVTKPVSVVAYRSITLEEGYYELTFEWQAGGIYNVDGMYVCWVPENKVDTTKLASADKSPFLQTDFINEKYGLYFGADSLGLGQRTWNAITDTIYSDGTKYNLVFVWRNGVVGLTPPAAAIDNIMIKELGSCKKPTGLSVAQKGDDVVFQWRGEADCYDVRYSLGEGSAPVYIDSITTKYCEIKDLFAGIATFYVRSRCGEERSAWSSFEKFIYSTGGECLNFLNLDPKKCFFGSTKNPKTQAGVVDYGYLAMESRHTIHWKQDEYDVRTNTGAEALKTVPKGEIASVRLGNWGVKYEAECIEYDYMVDSAKSAILLLNYAVVLQDPDHEAAEQPKFTLEILYNNKPLDEYGCGEAFFTAGENTDGPGWYCVTDDVTNIPVWWKDWTTIAINLREYHGKSLKIRLQTYDCNQGAHYGYAYFTLGCSDGKIKGLTCGNDSAYNVFQGPEGFLYRWYLPTNREVTLSEERIFRVPSSDTLTYYLDVIQPTNKQCYYTLTASAVARFPFADAEVEQISEDCKNVARFQNKSCIIRVNQVTNKVTKTDDPCESFYWVFSDGTTSTAENPTHIFPDKGGTYTATLYARIADGLCEEDTTFVLTFPEVGQINQVIDESICFGDPYFMNGDPQKPIYVAGTYSDTIFNEYGCEVISTLNLTVLPKPQDSYVYDTICSHEEYYFGDELITETGIYKKSFKTENGCDSVSTLDIVINESLFIDFDSTVWVCEDDENLIVPYSVLSGNFLSCDVDMKSVTNNISYVAASNVVPMPDALVVPMPDSIVPGRYNLNLTFAESACGLESVDLPISVYYSKQIMAQRWNDVLAVKNEKFNHLWNDNDTSGYQFVAFQWFKNGFPIADATSSILYEPDGLDLEAEYSVLLTRLPDNVSIMSCVADLKDLSADTNDEVLVFETNKTLSVVTSQEASMRIWTSTGILVDTIDVKVGENTLSTLGLSGMYILDFLLDDGSREIKQVVFE